jgi:Co/Zn/Cd efflux system component
MVSMSCHLISDSPSLALNKATKILKEKFGISHVTIQVEHQDEIVDFECENDFH